MFCYRRRLVRRDKVLHGIPLLAVLFGTACVARSQVNGETGVFSRLTQQKNIRPLTLKELQTEWPALEKVTIGKLLNAKLVIANQSALRRDFPDLLGHLSDDEIDLWLVNQVAYLAQSQIEASKNSNPQSTPIDAKVDQSRFAFRPPDYDRTIVIPVLPPSPQPQTPLEENPFLLEIKGGGSTSPKPGPKTSGLGLLAEALREYHLSNLVEVVLEHSGIGVNVEPIYAVIAGGFRVREVAPMDLPAGLMIRRSHLRGGADQDFRGLTQGGRGLDNRADVANLIKRTELTLRKYGISAAFPFPEDPKNPGSREYTNLQWTKNFSLVDMGSIHVRHVFKSKVVSGIDLIGLRDDNLSPSASENVAIAPTDEDFVKEPDPSLAVSIDAWGRPTWL